MNFRLIQWYESIFIVIGIGHNSKFDPPDVFLCLPMHAPSLFESSLSIADCIEIPFSEAIEITDKKRIQAIWILYGS